jgi:N-acetylmuramoyl-L-alanine amidase
MYQKKCLDRKTVCPAVLVENFFMDNEKDCAYLLDSQSNKECAEVIVRGLDGYLKESK